MQRKKSNVLILTICSDSKTKEGEVGAYDSGASICQCVPEQYTHRLFDGRRRIRALITSDAVSRNGKLLRDMPYNRDLGHGPDFQLKGVTQTTGKYLPAAKRYSGRFYRELGDDGPALLMDTPHHVLIVSGLYGLLTPAEPIQCYSCHVADHPDIARRWRDDDRLTGALVSYIEKFAITTVFDFMAEESYRRLISWDMISRATNGNVLHCFSEEFAGAALLPSLGNVAKTFLSELEDRLLRIKTGHTQRIRKYSAEVVFEGSLAPKSPNLAIEPERAEAASVKLPQENDFEFWTESLPFPLASILWTFHANADVQQKVKNLLHFFEALSQFTTTIMLSAYAADGTFYARESGAWIDKYRDAFITPTFGTWNTLGEILSKQIRRLLADTSKRARCVDLLGNPHSKFIGMLTDKRLFDILNVTRGYRNDWQGHGGIESEEQAHHRLNLLVEQLGRAQSVIADCYSTALLLSPASSEYSGGVFHYQVRALTGSRTTFRRVQVKTQTPMDRQRLYLLHKEQERPVALLPFLRLLVSPKARQDACYFYNRSSREGVRWISYHFTGESEIVQPDAEVQATLALLRAPATDPRKDNQH